jgi:hypothetical protein
MIKSVLTFLAFSVFVVSAHAQSFDLTAGLTPPNQQKTSIKYDGRFYDESEFPTGNSAIMQNGLSFSTPLSKSEGSSLALAGRADEMKINPARGDISGLYDFEMGLTYTRILEERRMWAVTGSYGSASDKPFYSPDESTLGLTALYMKPASETDTWLFLVNYSNNRPILNNIPLPGFAYFYNPSKEFRGVFGVPFAMVTWKFIDDWSINFFTLIPWVIKGSLNYSISGPLQVYLGWDFSQKTYLLADRAQKEDRLFYDEKKFFLGLKSPISQEVAFEIEAGHAFDRSFFVAENYEQDPSNPLEIGNAFYIKTVLSARF